MLVRRGDRPILEARAKAEPADEVVWRDYYTRQPQIRLTGDAADSTAQTTAATEVMLDDDDLARLVECAIRHPNANMRNAVLAAIWNDADAFRQIFRFGLDAPDGLPEIRKIVAEELARNLPTPKTTDAAPVKPAEALLPRMARPAHLRDRERQ